MSSHGDGNNNVPPGDDQYNHDNETTTSHQFDVLNTPDDNKNGYHVHYFPSGDLYKGNWLDNKMHGEGILTLNVDKEITSSTVLVLFQGEFENGLPIIGRAEYADGSVFDGELKDGLGNGQGIYTKGGLSVTGTFTMGQPQGHVTVLFQDGDDMTSYNGSLHQSFLHGINGMIRFPQSSIISSFQGNFDHNVRTNWGILTFRPPASTLMVEMNQDKIQQMVSEPKITSHTVLDLAYRYDGFNYVPGSNIFLSPHYHTHTATLNHQPIKKVYGQFENDRLIFGTIYYSDNSIYTGYLLAGTQTSNGTFIPSTSSTDPREINPFAPRENIISRYGFGVMFHYIGSNIGTITIADWNMDLPQGQVIIMYNYSQEKNINCLNWHQEIEFQQDFDELSQDNNDLIKKKSKHLIFQRDIISKGESSVISYLQQQAIDIQLYINQNKKNGENNENDGSKKNYGDNHNENDGSKISALDSDITSSTTAVTTVASDTDTTAVTVVAGSAVSETIPSSSNLQTLTPPPIQYSCDAIYVGHMQRGIRHDTGLFLSLSRYSTQVQIAQMTNDPNLNTPPILPNNEVDAYFGLFEDDHPHNQGNMVFHPSQQPHLKAGLTQLDVSWDYVNYFKTQYSFDMVAFHEYKHGLYKNNSPTELSSSSSPLSTAIATTSTKHSSTSSLSSSPTTLLSISPSTSYTSTSQTQLSQSDVNEDISLTYYRGLFFYSCRSFGLSLYTTATTESTQPETLFYGSHHCLTNDILARAKSRNHCQDVPSYLHSDIYRNNNTYRDYYLTRAQAHLEPKNIPTTPSSKRINLLPENLIEDPLDGTEVGDIVDDTNDQNNNNSTNIIDFEQIKNDKGVDYDLDLNEFEKNQKNQQKKDENQKNQEENDENDENDEIISSPTQEFSAKLTQPDYYAYAQRRHFTAQTAHLVRGESAYSGCLSLPNIGILFYFSPNAKLPSKRAHQQKKRSSGKNELSSEEGSNGTGGGNNGINGENIDNNSNTFSTASLDTTNSSSKNDDNKIPLLERIGPYKKVSLWFGAVTTTLQRLGHGCLCLDINMTQFIKLHPQQQFLKTTNAPQGALSALRHQRSNNNNQKNNQQNQPQWHNGNYYDPLNHPLLLYLMQDQQSHVNGFAQISGHNSIFSASSTAAGSSSISSTASSQSSTPSGSIFSRDTNSHSKSHHSSLNSTQGSALTSSQFQQQQVLKLFNCEKITTSASTKIFSFFLFDLTFFGTIMTSTMVWQGPIATIPLPEIEGFDISHENCSQNTGQNVGPNGQNGQNGQNGNQNTGQNVQNITKSSTFFDVFKQFLIYVTILAEQHVTGISSRSLTDLIANQQSNKMVDEAFNRIVQRFSPQSPSKNPFITTNIHILIDFLSQIRTTLVSKDSTVSVVFETLRFHLLAASLLAHQKTNTTSPINLPTTGLQQNTQKSMKYSKSSQSPPNNSPNSNNNMNSKQILTLRPCCPQIGQFYPFGCGEVRYLQRQHLDPSANQSMVTINEKFTGFVLLAPLSIDKDKKFTFSHPHLSTSSTSSSSVSTQLVSSSSSSSSSVSSQLIEPSSSFKTLMNQSNSRVLNSWIDNVDKVYTALGELGGGNPLQNLNTEGQGDGQGSHKKTLDQFQRDGLINLTLFATLIEKLTNNDSFISNQSDFGSEFGKIRHPSQEIDSKGKTIILPPQSMHLKESQLFYSSIEKLPQNPLEMMFIDDKNDQNNKNNENFITQNTMNLIKTGRFGLINVLLDGALSSTHSPHIFMGNLVDISPKISIISNSSVLHLTDKLSLLPVSHGNGIITAGNLSQNKTYGKFHLGLILEGIEIDDTGDIFIGPYITVVREDGEKIQQKHGKYLVILTLRKWIVVCNYAHGNVIDGKVFYNVAQHILQEASMLTAADIQNFEMDKFISYLYDHRRALAQKMTKIGKNSNSSSSSSDQNSNSLTPTGTSLPRSLIHELDEDYLHSNQSGYQNEENSEENNQNDEKKQDENYQNDDENFDDIFALGYDPLQTDITELHGYLPYYTCTNDDTDKALEILYEDELVGLLYATTEPPKVDGGGGDDENSTVSKSESNSQKKNLKNKPKSLQDKETIIRVTSDGLVCFDQYTLNDPHIDTNDITTTLDNLENSHSHVYSASLLSDQVRTTRCFRYRLPNPDAIGQLSRLFYCGGLDDGFLPDGSGVLTWSTPTTRASLTKQQHFASNLSPETAPCEVYIGEFQHGVLHGQGKVHFHTPIDYELVNFNAPTHVSSSFLCPCITSFEGQFQVGSPIQGVVKFDPKSFSQGQNYSLYTGELNLSGEFQGQGELIYSSGHHFIGTFAHSRPIDGELKFNNGIKYNGPMHCAGLQDSLLDPFYLMVQKKFNTILSNLNNNHYHTANRAFLPPSVLLNGGTNGMSTIDGKNKQQQDNDGRLSDEHVALGNTFALSHFVLFSQLCTFLSQYYQPYAISQQQQLPIVSEYQDEDDEDYNGGASGTGVGGGVEDQHQQVSQGFFDVPLPVQLSLFSPLFTDVTRQYEEYQQEQQKHGQHGQQGVPPKYNGDQDQLDRSGRPSSSTSTGSTASSSSSQDVTSSSSTVSIFDLRSRLQILMIRLKELNALHSVSGTDHGQNTGQNGQKSRIFLPIPSQSHSVFSSTSSSTGSPSKNTSSPSLLSSTALVPMSPTDDIETIDADNNDNDGKNEKEEKNINKNENMVDSMNDCGIEKEAIKRDLTEKLLETDIIQYAYDLKSLTTELYPELELRPTTTNLVPIEQQAQTIAMYILLQGRLTVVSLSQISRLFGTGTLTFPDLTIYDEKNSSQNNYMERCKEIITKTVNLCLNNTKDTIKDLTTVSSSSDQSYTSSWPVLPLPSSIAIQHQFESRQQRIKKHTGSLTLSIHSNINLDQFTTQREHQQFIVSSNNYKSRVNDTITKGLQEIQQIVLTEAARCLSGQKIDSLTSFLDEISDNDDDDDNDFDPTVDIDELRRRKEEKKLLKKEKIRQKEEDEKKNSNSQQNKKSSLPTPRSGIISSGGIIGNDNNLPSFDTLRNKDGSSSSSASNSNPRARSPSSPGGGIGGRRNIQSAGGSGSIMHNGLEVQYDTICDSHQYVESKLSELRAFKDQITARLNKLSKMLKIEEQDYTSCCQRFGRDQFEQQDAKIVTAPIWSQFMATKMLFEKQLDMVEIVSKKDHEIMNDPTYSVDIYTIIDTNIDIWELFLLRKEILLEDRLKVFFLLTKITLAFKHRRLFLVLLLHALSKHDIFINLIDSGLKTLNSDFLKNLLGPTKNLFGQIGTTNQLITDLKTKLKTTLMGLFNTTVPTTQQVQTQFVNSVLQTAIMEFTALRSKLNSTTSELESIITTLNQTLDNTTKILEARHKQRKQLSQVLFVEELQQHILKNDLLSVYSLIYATNYHPMAQEQLLSRRTKDHPLDLTQSSQQTFLTPIQLACSLGLSHMVVLLYKLGCSLQQKTLCSYQQMTDEMVQQRDKIKKLNSDKDALHRLTLEHTIPEVISNKTIVELIVDSKHYDMLGVLAFLKFNFDGVKATTVTTRLDSENGDTIVKHTVRPLLQHYVIKSDIVVVKYLLLLGMDPNVCDLNDGHLTPLMLACRVFSHLCLKQAKFEKNSKSSSSSSTQIDQFASSSAYEDNTSFGIAITPKSLQNEEEELQFKIESAMEIIQVLVQYGAKVASKDDQDNTILHHLFSAFYSQTPAPNTQQFFPVSLKQLSSWLVGHGARYRELRNKKNQPAYYHQQLCTEFDTLRNAYLLQSQQFHYNFAPLTSLDQRWQNDDDCLTCTDCSAEFGLFTRKHHCRCCGYIFCDQCSKITINNSSIKTCVSCYNKMHMLTLPRDRRREQLAAQQRATKTRPGTGSPVGAIQPSPTNEEKVNAGSMTYNYGGAFLPQFIQEFHTEIVTLKPKLSQLVFDKRGICWFIPQVAKTVIKGFVLSPNMGLTTIDRIITPQDVHTLSIPRIDNRYNAPEPVVQTATVPGQRGPVPGRVGPAGAITAQQQHQGRTMAGTNAHNRPIGGTNPQPNRLAAPPPPKDTSKLPPPPPPSGINTKLPAPPPPSNASIPTTVTPIHPLAINTTTPADPTTISSDTVEGEKTKEHDFTFQPHVGVVGRYSTQIEQETIERMVKDLLEQTGASIGTNIQQDKLRSERPNGADFILIKVVNNDDDDNDNVDENGQKKKNSSGSKKARNPLEDDDFEDVHQNTALSYATQIQPTPLDDHFGTTSVKETDVDDLFG